MYFNKSKGKKSGFVYKTSNMWEQKKKRGKVLKKQKELEPSSNLDGLGLRAAVRSRR
jgi:hypothetical protein